MKKSLLTILCVLLSTISWAQGTTAGDSTAVAEPYAVLSADSLTVTFYYDNQKSARGGMDINNSYIDDGNSSPYGTATMAVFDASFANYLPTSTAYWFQRCNLLTEIRGLSNLNSANVTNMRFMFDNCSSLTNLDMSGFNTTNVTDMVLLFAGCSALTSLDLSGLNTTNVTEMNWMFDGCSSLTSLDVSGFNTANVTNMSGMFHECSSLTSLDLSGFNTANVTNMSWMFERCSALTNIYVSSTWTTSQVTANNGSNMFNECVNLVGGAGTTFSADHTDYTYARIDGGPDSQTPGYFTDKNAPTSYNVMVKVVGNGEVMAGQTTIMGGNEQEVTVLAGDSLQMYFFPAHDWTLGSLKVDDADVTSEVTRNSETGTLQYLLTVSGSHSVNVTFTEVTPEAYAVLTDNQDVISQGATGITYGKTLTFYYDTNKSTYPDAMSVGPFDSGNDVSWLGNLNNITEVNFNDSFASYRPTSTAFWFMGFSRLTTITGLENLNTSSVTEMRYMFQNCSSLLSLDLRNFNTESLTSMVYMFGGCSALTSVNLSSFNTSNVTTLNSMFNGCSSLVDIDVTNFNTENVTDLGWVFANCSSLTSLDLSSFNTEKVTVLSYMFTECGSLEKIYVGSGWSIANVTSGTGTFTHCTKLVGGAGTAYADVNYNHYDYAHIDGGTSNPGYFTDKNAAPVVDEDLKDDVYTVGESDFSTEFYTQFSKYYQIPQGGKWVSKFKLNLNPNDNRIYKNFVLLITNDEDRGAGQYKEYGAFRYDAVADSTRTNSQWGTSYVFPFQYTTSTLYLEPDENEMDPNVQKLGGLVTLTVDRSQADAFVITMSNEQGVVKTYRQPYVLPNFNNDSTNTNIRCFITVENSQLEFKGSNIEPIGGYSAPVVSVEPYAVLKGDTLLTFYYDDQKEARNGMSVGPFDNYDNVSWYANRGTITKVVFDESFANCTSLTSTAYWFRGMSALTTIEGIINLKTDNVTSMGSMFRGCSGLTSLDVSGFNTANVTDMNRLFGGCSGLTSLDVSGFNTDNVTSMSEMFAGCSGLKTIYAGNETLVSVNDFSTMPDQPFPYYLMGVEPSIINGAMHYESDGNYNQFIIFPGGNNQLTEGNYVVRLYMASNKDADGVQLTVQNGWGDDAQNFTLPVPVVAGDHVYELKLPGLTGTPSTGYDCILKPQTVECILDVKKIEFYKLEYSAVVNWNTDNVTEGTAMFDGCTSLVGGAGTVYDANHTDHTYAHIDGGENNPGYFTDKNASYNEAYAVLVSEDGGNIMYATLYYDGNKASHTEGFAVVGLDEMLQNQAWMMNRGSIQTVTFDESFANCNPTSTAYWFAFCNSLTAINGLQYLNTEYVTNMEYMFHMCPALTSIDLSHFRAKSLTNMNSMFGGCSSLTSLDLSGFFTFTVTNMNYLFSGCTNLKTIYVNKYDWSTESVTAGDGVFENCTSLVGGAGTTFNDSHIDYTYARVDGGPNSTTPGYFTDKNAPITVAAPEFRFEGDNLTMTTETQNAGIFYKVADLPSMDDAVVESVVNSLIVTADGQSTYYDQPFELKKAAVVKAIAIIRNETATFVSDTTTMVYDYEAWVNLKAAVASGVDLYSRAQGNPNVDTQLLEQLQWALNEGDMIYKNRAQMDSFEATHFTQRINELCAQIEAQMTPTEQVATPNFSWQNDELTISTTTEGADIYYWLSDVDVNGDGVITDADYAHYNNPLTIQRDVTIKAYAAKQAMDNSEIRTLDYPYTSWQTLREVISYASSVADRARHSTKVPDQEVTSFEEDIAASYDMYERRTETKDRVEEVARYLSERAYEIERMMEVEATFVDGVLTIEGTTTVAEALESFGVSTVTESIAAIVYNSSVPMANSDLQAITNPNLLIYVKSDSLAPADRNNIIVDGFAKNIVLTDVAQGNNDFYCPQSFTAEAISYTREFKQKTQIGVSRGWETIALPFNVQTIMHETRGLITPFGNNRSNTHFWLRRLTRDGLQSDSIMEANTAYLISMPNSEEYIAEYNLAGRVTFSAANVTVPVTEIIMDESANYMMAPVFQRLAAQNNLYVLNVGEQRNGYPEGSIFESNYRAVLPFQAYTEHKGSNPAPPYFIVGDLGGDTTGIDATLMNSERVNSEAWYTLDGRKLQGKPTQKGVYITNGKKVIIK